LTTHTIHIDQVDAFVFDFDGVLTDNLVHLNQDGKEWVSCSRADGLAFDLLRKLNKPAYILSTEKNPVVSARAKKLQVPVLQGVDNKVDAIKDLVDQDGFELQKIFYVGNDLNDYRVMKLCGYSACPADSHSKIKQIATFVLSTKGGNGIARELLEDIMKLNLIHVLYPNEERKK
jgi:3-deoxy-D-manno-octulosonate 8-phosphate phosphatase (KDO 8-P phosphatase)